MTWSDGQRYEGEWSENVKCGQGKMKKADGEIYEGEFEEDLLIEGEITTLDGDIYEGNFIDYCLYGQGTITLKNG